MNRLLLATKNAGKIREIRRLSEATPLQWVSLEEFPAIEEPDETGRTFTDNARLKALYYAEQSGLPALADDSGLEVDAIGGAPGVDSAHFAGRPRDDLANNRALIAALRDIRPDLRTARYRCILAFADRGCVQLESTGAVEGHIVAEARGNGGFGYDPHFWLPEFNCTMAELPPDTKNETSHRGRALRAILPQIERYFAPPRPTATIRP